MNSLLKKLNMENISDLFDKCYEKASFENGIPEWLTENYVRQAVKEFPFLSVNLENVISALPDVCKKQELILFAKTLYHMLGTRKRHEYVFEGLKFPKAPLGEKTLAYDMFAFFPIFARVREMYNELKNSGVDEKILCDTASGIDGSITASTKREGRLSFSLDYFLWTTVHSTGSLFRIGIFNFELREKCNLNIYAFKNKNGEIKVLLEGGIKVHKDGWMLGSVDSKDAEGAFVTTYKERNDCYIGYSVNQENARVEKEPCELYKCEWEIFYEPGDDLVSVHIPASAAFSEENITESISKCIEFLGDTYPEKNFKGFMCISWLLAPELNLFLKPTSNIIKFSNRFTKFPVVCGGLDAFAFVFFRSVSDLSEIDFEALPQKTSLEKCLKAHYRSGKYVHETGGIFPFKTK